MSQSANPAPADVTTGGVVDTSGNNWLASLFCGQPMYTPSGAAIGLPYCIQYWNEAGFAAPPSPTTIPVPGDLTTQGVGVNDPLNEIDTLTTDYSAALALQSQDFFNSIDITDSAIGGPNDPTTTLMWWIVGGLAAIVVLREVI
jgi:hypothetical protein